MTPIDHFAYGDQQPGHCSDAEWAQRIRLAHCYRLVDDFGWGETIFNHISMRVPGAPHYLVNPFGLNYNEVTPANLLKIDLNGELVESSRYKANPAGFALHSAIHGARDDLHCVIHTHTTPISAVTMKKAGFEHNDFYGAQLFGRIGYHDFEGITLFADERERIVGNLGGKHILVLRNHGVVVCESDIARAFFLLWTVQRAAEIQSTGRAMAGEDQQLSDAVRQKCAGLTQRLIREEGFAELFFDAAVRRMLMKQELM